MLNVERERERERRESERLDLIELGRDTRERKPLEAKVSSNFK